MKKILSVALLLFLFITFVPAYGPQVYASDHHHHDDVINEIVYEDDTQFVPHDLQVEPKAADESAVYQRLIALKAIFPDGRYWNHYVSNESQMTDNLGKWDETFGDSVTDSPCGTHTSSYTLNMFDCNRFDGGLQCWGFANRIFYAIFGIRASQMTQVYGTDIKVGDWVRVNNDGHSGIVLSISGNTFTMAEANVGSNCRIKWGSITYNKSQITYYKRASNYASIVAVGKLDVGGILDGTNNYSTGEYGTFDVYINNVLKANDVNDYANDNLPHGATYKITDIKAKDGYSYDGSSQTFSGTITSGSTSIVWLPFNSCKLDVKGYLDKQIRDTLESYGTFDVYINGVLTANDVNDFNQRVTKGASYEIKDIKAKNGYQYENVYSGSLTGTIGSGTKTVTLSFYKVGELSCDWIETNTLPANVTTENCDIQYNNHYQKTASSSPGSGWTVSGSGTTKYEGTGQVKDYLHQQTESNTLKYKGFYYFHYCGSNNMANYEYDASRGFTQYHNPGDPDSFDVVSEGTDSDDPSLTYYKLSWKQPNPNNWTTAYCSDNTSTRSAVYFRMYQYEVYKAVTYYTWVKDSGWTTTRDSSANSVTYRYKLKSDRCGATSVTIKNSGGTDITGKTVTVNADTYQLKAVASPSSAPQEFSWRSGSSKIAAVDQNGKVTFKKEGKVTFVATATDGSGKSAKVTLVYVSALEIKDTDVEGYMNDIRIKVAYMDNTGGFGVTVYDLEDNKVSGITVTTEVNAAGTYHIIHVKGDNLENTMIYKLKIYRYITISGTKYKSNTVTKYGMPTKFVRGLTAAPENGGVTLNSAPLAGTDGTRYQIRDAKTSAAVQSKMITGSDKVWNVSNLENGHRYYVTARAYNKYDGHNVFGALLYKTYFIPLKAPGKTTITFTSSTAMKVTIASDTAADGIRVLYRTVGGALKNGCEAKGMSCTIKNVSKTGAYELYVMKYKTSPSGQKHYSRGRLETYNTDAGGMNAPTEPLVVVYGETYRFSITKAGSAKGISVLYRQGTGDFRLACEKASDTCQTDLPDVGNYTFYIMQYKLNSAGKKVYSPGVIAKTRFSPKSAGGAEFYTEEAEDFDTGVLYDALEDYTSEADDLMNEAYEVMGVDPMDDAEIAEVSAEESLMDLEDLTDEDPEAYNSEELMYEDPEDMDWDELFMEDDAVISEVSSGTVSGKTGDPISFYWLEDRTGDSTVPSFGN